MCMYECNVTDRCIVELLDVLVINWFSTLSVVSIYCNWFVYYNPSLSHLSLFLVVIHNVHVTGNY